jgi:peptidoglycan/LPS O-acetylase OafA/YrhL
VPTHQLPRKPIRREIELDFIRGIAILLVMDFHAPTSILLAPFAWLGFKNFGWAGVDIFFVLSGFLVGGLLIKEWKLSSQIDGKRFLIRRGFKIWPQYYAFLVAMLLTGHRGLHALWGNLLNIQNYVGGVAHTWTLAVEEHAYLLLVAIMAFAARKRVKIRGLFIVIGVMALSVLAWRTLLAARGVNVFMRTDTRIDGILYGLMLAILYHDVPVLFRRIQSWKGVWLGVTILALAYFRVNPTTWWSADISWGFADAMGVALLLLLYKHREGKQRPALYRLVAWVGLYSYGIYLWHVSVVAPIVLVAHRLPHRVGMVFLAVAPVLLGIAVGVLTTKAVEFPTLTLRDRLFPRRVDSAVGVPALIENELGIGPAPELIPAGSGCSTATKSTPRII